MDFQVPQGAIPAGRGFGQGWGSRGQLSKNASAPGGAAGSPGGTAQNSSAPASPFQAPNPIEDPTAPGGGGASPEAPMHSAVMPHDTQPPISTTQVMPPPATPPFSPPPSSPWRPNRAFSPRMWAGSGQPNPQDIGKTFGPEIFQPLATGPHASIPPPGGAPPPPPSGGNPSGPSSFGDFVGRALGGMASGAGFVAPFQSAGGGWNK